MKVDKFQLQKEMLSMYETIIHDLKAELNLKESLANIDEDNTLDPEDYSNQTVSKEMKMLLQKQLDISYNKFQILLDVCAYDFDKEFHTKNKNYMEYMVNANICYTGLYPAIDVIKFNNNGAKINSKRLRSFLQDGPTWRLMCRQKLFARQICRR